MKRIVAIAVVGSSAFFGHAAATELEAPVPAPAASGASTTPSALERAYALDAGKSGARDAAAAAAAYAEAAAAGDAVAHVRLGYLCETGDGIPQDYVAARAHYQAAADAGLADGRLHLAICLLEGWGGPVDRPGFVREIRTAAEAGNAHAERILASLYIMGLEVPRDSALAVQWLERAAKQGDAAAALAVGQHAEYEARVRSLMHDETLARSWYQLSAEKEYTQAMRAMARTFLIGSRSDRNWALGSRWLELATESGDAEAPYLLAMFEMLHVDSPVHDEAVALKYLKIAADRGNERATEVLQLQQSGKPLDEAFRYLLKVSFEDRYVQRSLARPRTDPTHPPAVYKLVKPVYPLSLRLSETTGKVLVDFVVDTAGRVQRAKAIQSSHPLFAERAVRAVEQWRFYPAQKNGRNVNTHMQVPVLFQLNEEEFNGVDGVLGSARDLAHRQGGAAAADADNLSMAVPDGRLVAPLGPDGKPLTPARVLLLLVIDATGTPIRGHILESKPETAGPVVLASALRARFVPRDEAGTKVESHVILPYVAGHPTDPVLR